LPVSAAQGGAPWLWGVFFITRLFHLRSTGYNKARLTRQKQGLGRISRYQTGKDWRIAGEIWGNTKSGEKYAVYPFAVF